MLALRSSTASRLLAAVQQCVVAPALLSARGWSSDSASKEDGQLPGGSSHLPSRAVVQAEGEQLLAFLQGLVTNDLRPLEASGSDRKDLVYAAILTPKGKFLHDVFISHHPDKPGCFLLDLDARGKDAAVQLLNRYKLRRKIAFTPVPELKVWACWGSALPVPAHSEGPWLADPRLPQLGFRAIAPGQPFTPTGSAAASEQDFRQLRYRLGVAEGEEEIPTGQGAPLDYNLDQLDGVSYTKGCYVGQERNSFTHYRGIIRKRLMPVVLEPPLAAGAAQQPQEVVDLSGQSVGQLRGASGRFGLAYLKLQPALAAASSQVPFNVADVGDQQSATVLPVRPFWWPIDWGREELSPNDSLL